MKGGRKNLKRAAEDKMATLPQGQTIMQVADLRGSNVLEVMDAKGQKLIAIFPAKFQKSMWIKRGNFVVVDESGREEAIESGRKVAGMVTQVLYHDQVRLLQKSSAWPQIFRSLSDEKLKEGLNSSTSHNDDDDNDECSSDDGVPPLEANTNRINPLLDVESESDSDTDSDL